MNYPSGRISVNVSYAVQRGEFQDITRQNSRPLSDLTDSQLSCIKYHARTCFPNSPGHLSQKVVNMGTN